MKFETYPQEIFPEDFVQWVKPERTLQNYEMARMCIEQWQKKPRIFLFHSDDIERKVGHSLNNDLSQAIAHAHSWGGYLHFKSSSENGIPNGSSFPPTFCRKESIGTAMREGYNEIQSSIRGIQSKIYVGVTDVGWPMEWEGVPSVQIEEALQKMNDSDDVIFYQSCARIRKTVEALLLEQYISPKVMASFVEVGQKSIVYESVSIDVSDGKTIAFSPKIGHYRLYKGQNGRPGHEIPFGGKIELS